MAQHEVYANMPSYFDRQIAEAAIDPAAEPVRFSYKNSVGTIRPETQQS